jgi:hypothetical protein
MGSARLGETIPGGQPILVEGSWGAALVGMLLRPKPILPRFTIPARCPIVSPSKA